MTDLERRERVVKGLECCSREVPAVCENMGCPYVNEHRKRGEFETICMDHMMRDALALLKALEPVEPQKKQFVICGTDEYGVTDFTTVCGACGAWLISVNPRPKYCPQCGRAVKWK